MVGFDRQALEGEETDQNGTMYLDFFDIFTFLHETVQQCVFF